MVLGIVGEYVSMIGIRHPPPVYTGLKKSVLDATLELRRMLRSITTGEPELTM